MALIDRFRKSRQSEPAGFKIEFGEQTRFIADPAALNRMRSGAGSRTEQEQFFILDCLVDEGFAESDDDGFVVSADQISRLDPADAAVLDLPGRFEGELKAKVHRWTASPDFRIDLTLQTGPHPAPYKRTGPIVSVSGNTFRLSVPLLDSLRAIEDHRAGDQTETENVRLVARLQTAQRLAHHAESPAERDDHFALALGSMDSFRSFTPTNVGLIVEPQDDGSLAIAPDLGPDTNPSTLSSRWHQLDRQRDLNPPNDDTEKSESAVIRADDQLILLENRQLAGVKEVLKRPMVEAEHAAQFFQAPGSYYDPEIVDVDLNFSLRVAGLGVMAPVSFNMASANGLDWFSELTSVKGPRELARLANSSAQQQEIETTIASAWERGEDVAVVGEQLIDISDREQVEAALSDARKRIGKERSPSTQEDAASENGLSGSVTVGMHLHDAEPLPDVLRRRAADARPHKPADYASIRRDPFPHQKIGIEWMTGLIQSSLASSARDPGRIQGALLADDMGLGKTFMILVALAETARFQADMDLDRLPVLAVMPAALLENWQQELADTFTGSHGPFEDVVVLQGKGLSEYRLRGSNRETSARREDLDEHGMVRADRVHATLRIGSQWKEARLDRPGVLVLATYETLRRYQVSLGLVEWGVVVFDEAQATKNPEILTTRAAKALKARFKLLATGTPVENSLRDFWSLLDTAQPGLLGAWSDFQQTWVSPMESADPQEHQRLGQELRRTVGSFMLRRVKEDHLPDLPAKHIHEHPQQMPEIQAQAYDQVLARHRDRVGEKGSALKTLHELGMVSLHPGLLGGRGLAEAGEAADSARVKVTIRVILEDIQARNEKVIVFAKTKEVQRALARWIFEVFGIRASTVNGDVAATGRGSNSRIGKIRAFEAREGFNVIIMSPLAVGVGLTVVGANHAVHLERHWNPAKEAQATDRIYRIGQTRDVHVYYPVALHPTLESFDSKLDRLLRTKTVLKDAVVVPQEVRHEEMEQTLGLS